MSTKQDVTKAHRCIAAKCKGTLREPVTNYGYWAYWRAATPDGWYSSP